ncbi:CWF19-like protein 2 [Punica granatum]|uniref:CWF19-like protein 2 n=2 Tax=Punica granatum TaxID=22663 RepID=A0A6P8CIZ1_PUNGR|nr:CWF19-like protein 2 [Punica granatum]
MLSGIKFVPRDQIKGQGQGLDSVEKSGSGRKEKRGKAKSARYSSSDDDGDDKLEKIEKGSRKKKWYSSEEPSSSDSESSDGKDTRKRRKKKKKSSSRRSRSSRKSYSSEDSSDPEDSGGGRRSSRKEKHRKKVSSRRRKESGSDDDVSEDAFDDQKIVRKEMGLEWMLRHDDRTERRRAVSTDDATPEPPKEEEVKKVNPRELNPYLRDNGSGYPEEGADKPSGDRLLSSSIGDGGASWRLKALKRAQEQAAREGRKVEEVVAERWGSLGQLTVSVSSRSVAPSRAHLSAIKSRQRGSAEEPNTAGDEKNENDTRKGPREYLKDVSIRNSQMRKPKVDNSLSWGKRKGHKVSAKDASFISAAASSLNKFSNDGRFMEEALQKQSNDSTVAVSASVSEGELTQQVSEPNDAIKEILNEGLSANQLAAKALQLRLKGKHDEAQKLLNEVENLKVKERDDGGNSLRVQPAQTMSRHMSREFSSRRNKDDDADMHLARTIMQNKQYSISGQAEDEYGYEVAPKKKSRHKGTESNSKANQRSAPQNRLVTQQERCLFCFENPNRPKHLVVSIANFTYLMLPQRQPVVPGHCCIVTAQHESSTRTVDDNVWNEIRNFKKCLIMMYAKQEREAVFLETVMGLAQQRRHCLVECVPLPKDAAKQAPLYFKKAIDEAEDEWSQHNAKRLIDTSEKGLRGSIPKDFPYFHVEFGLNRGFVHVIDDEMQFKSSLGLNVIRGMLQLPEEDMYRRRRAESVDVQRQAVASFAQEWEPFDWTKQLD